jgi:DAPG hydrolase PhiG domain
MQISAASEVVTARSWQDEIEHLSPTKIRVAALDELGGITPAMFEWWFANMDYDTYVRFHPDDHKAFAWTRGKQPGRYVGATHLTYHQYGGSGPVLRSEISFVEPATLYPPATLAALDGGHALVAIVHLLDEQDRPFAAEAGRFTHVVLPRAYGSELRSCWWLNVGPETDLELVTAGRLRHVHEEFTYLQDFLPELHADARRR